ncbi:hypothetical protein A7982_13937 [Minicystis rosea]|nr:hypothetical protein A7982_13937 [Minicystis rosea]
MKIIALAAVVAASSILFGACSVIDNALDCNAICDRYQSCFDQDYDTAACQSRCRSNADNDKDFDKKTDICSTCIDDETCVSATFKCASECVGIVP